MPNGLLTDKYKGKAFGEIAKDIQAKYKDRFDPISKKGLMAEMSALKEQQEYQKAKMEAKEMLDQVLQQQKMAQQQAMMGQDPMQQDMGMQQDPNMQPQMGMEQPQQMGQPPVSNMGISPEMPQQDMGNFQRAASQSYNEQFAYGGTMDYYGGGFMGQNNNTNFGQTSPEINLANYGNARFATPSFNQTPTKFSFAPQAQSPRQQNSQVDLTSFLKRPDLNLSVTTPGLRKQLQSQEFNRNINNTNNSQQQLSQNQGVNPLRYAPLASNLYNIISARKAKPIEDDLRRMGYDTSIDDTLATRVNPRQTQFSNVDMSQIERGITDQARGFTGANLNASGGNSGQFMANELANQGNVMNAIANARMQAQGQDRQTQAMNAQEQARIDQFRQGQYGQLAGIQGQNINIGTQLADLNARNLGAFNTNRSAQIAGLASNIGNIGKEEDQMDMIANTLGYNSFGEYVANMTPEERKRLFPSLTGRMKQAVKGNKK
jgi:hypothetical protein